MRSVSWSRKHLAQDDIKCIKNIFIISQLSYCILLLYRLPKLEHEIAMNLSTAACLTTNQMDPITSMPRELHWLPVNTLL